MLLLLNVLLFLYGALVLLGVSLLSTQAFTWCFRLRSIGEKFALPLGFAVAPVLISYAGFLELGRVPLLSVFAGAAFMLYAVFRGMNHFPKRILSRPIVFLLILPLVAAMTLLFAKQCYFLGGINNRDDDLRSVAITSTFAGNALRPSFPFDLSVPVSYSYYTFELSAFVYSAFGGAGFPATAVLLVNLWILFLFYYVLYLTAEQVFVKHVFSKYFIVTLFITFYGFDSFVPSVYGAHHIEWWNWKQITQLSSYFEWVYQYLWSASLILLGLVFLQRYMQKTNRTDWAMFVTFFLLAAGHGAITTVWSAYAVTALILLFILRRRLHAVKGLIRMIPMSVLLLLFVLLPQVFTFIQRDVIFNFKEPHFWFAPMPNLFPYAHALWEQNVLIALTEFGPFLFLGFFSALAVLFWRKTEQARRFLPYSIVILVSLCIMSTTASAYFDWYSRGILVATLLSAFFAAELFHAPLFHRKRNMRIVSWVIVGGLLVPQARTFFLEHQFRKDSCSLPSAHSWQLNQKYPLGTLFYSQSGQFFEDVALAGRMFLTPVPPMITVYLNKDSFLQSVIGWQQPYTPCTSTRYGMSTPTGRFIELTPDGAEVPRSCPRSSSPSAAAR